MLTNIKTLAYNKRQITLMEQEIADYKKGTLNLLSFMNSIESLAYCMKEVSDEWRRAIITQANRMDVIYAVTSYKNQPLTADDYQEIDEYISVVASLINDYKKEYKLDDFDEEYEECLLLYPDNKS